VSEAVSVEDRAAYYDKSGVLRDMIQNHMFQMLAYVCMEPPTSFSADDIRDEKSKLLKAIRVYTPEEVQANCVRGQYGAGKKADGAECPDYRKEEGVDPKSNTETFAALKLHIDNWRWEGVPVYLRSGKALWKRGTEIVVQFKKAPVSVFRGTAVPKLSANRLIFHIQPDQGIELLFQAKTPGPRMRLQSVNMRFGYGEAFRAPRGTGYEVMLYSCMHGDPTLFSRTDLVETAWRIAQPLLDAWKAKPAADFPNYPAGTWGPKTAYKLIENDGRKWYEVINRDVLAKIPLFAGADPVFLNAVQQVLRPVVVDAGETVIRKGETGHEMYLIARGQVEVLDGNNQLIAKLGDGNYFGEIALLLSQPRTATVRTLTACDLFVLDRVDFSRLLRDQPQFVDPLVETARSRYHLTVAAEHVVGAPD
jgi:glucose-6-phosphate 1-dehydrogenase